MSCCTLTAAERRACGVRLYDKGKPGESRGRKASRLSHQVLVSLPVELPNGSWAPALGSPRALPRASLRYHASAMKSSVTELSSLGWHAGVPDLTGSSSTMLLRANSPKGGDAESRGYGGTSAMPAGPPAFRCWQDAREENREDMHLDTTQPLSQLSSRGGGGGSGCARRLQRGESHSGR